MTAWLFQVRDRWLRPQEYRVDGEPVARFLKWTLVSTRYFRIFFHKFNGPDWAIDPHDHPAAFVSVGLKGSYIEQVYDSGGKVLYERQWRAPWIRFFPRNHIHRMSWVSPRGAYTLCFVTYWQREWGYLVDGKMIVYRDYIKRYRSKRADRSESPACAADQEPK
jgi:hypothetical protein